MGLVLEEHSSEHLDFGPSLICLLTSGSMSTHTNPFAEWSYPSAERAPSIFGALPSIPIAPSLPVFISESLVLQFSPRNPNDMLNCVIRGPQNRSLFSISSDATTTTFRTSDSQVFAIARLDQQAFVEISGCTSRQRVRDWLRLSPDHSCRYMSIGNKKCLWRPVQQHILVCLSIYSKIISSLTLP